MAFTVAEMFVGLTPYSWYNVTYAVGPNGANYFDDVCLVQILLSYLRPYVPELQRPTLKPLRVDGICGPITESYIDAFALSHGSTNAKVERGHKHRAETIIYSLNYVLHERAPAAHEGIPNDLRTPPLLRESLKHVI
jgi:hypothetical protein